MKGRVFVVAIFLLFALAAQAQYDTIVFSLKGGFYDDVITLELQCNNPQNHIRYTTNGSNPTAQSQLYTEPLVLDKKMYSKSNIYTLRNCPEDQFRKLDSIDHCIVIRATVFDENEVFASETYTNSYFIRALGFDSHGLPVVSLCVDSVDLFDPDKGIFVEGNHYDPSKPHWSGNYYQSGLEWERWANFEFYELDNSSINQQCGVRTHGGNGRRFQQKTLKILARKKYGKPYFEFPFFPNISLCQFKRIVLRPFLSCNAGCEDYICNRMAQQLGLDFMADCPSVLFINGEYWGIYYVKEKPDEHYVESHYGVDSRSVNLQWRWFGEVENGSPDRFNTFFEWMKTADLRDETQYAYADAFIDIDNYLDYCLLEMFIANFDWPANNVRFWQSGDSKFRWLFYDGDAALENLDFDVFANATYVGEESYPSNKEATLFLRKLLESPKFQQKFARRFNELITTTFSVRNTMAIFDFIKEALDEETHRQFGRFDPPEDYYPSKYETWLLHLKMTSDFLETRPCHNFLSMPRPTVKEMQWYHYNDAVWLQVGSDSFGSEEINVFNLEGKMVYSQACVLAKGHNAVAVGIDLPAGLYLVRVGDCIRKVLWL